MFAFKFLSAGRTGPYSGVRWAAPSDGRPGEEVAAAASLPEWREGVRGCRACDLPHWIEEELWVVELTDPVVVRDRRLSAPRGRLVERVDAWSSSAWLELAEDCLERARRVAEAVPGDGDSATRLIAEYASDVERYTREVPEEGVPFVSCAAYITALEAGEAAALHDPANGDGARAEAIAIERHRQSAWMAERLGLRRREMPPSSLTCERCVDRTQNALDPTS